MQRHSPAVAGRLRTMPRPQSAAAGAHLIRWRAGAEHSPTGSPWSSVSAWNSAHALLEGGCRSAAFHAQSKVWQWPRQPAWRARTKAAGPAERRRRQTLHGHVAMPRPARNEHQRDRRRRRQQRQHGTKARRTFGAAWTESSLARQRGRRNACKRPLVLLFSIYLAWQAVLQTASSAASCFRALLTPAQGACDVNIGCDKNAHQVRKAARINRRPRTAEANNVSDIVPSRKGQDASVCVAIQA